MPATGRGSAASAKAFQCPDCPKAFSRAEYVVRHARQVHQGARPYPCKMCDASFSRSDLLKRHERICSGRPKEEEPPVHQARPLEPAPTAAAGSVSLPPFAEHQQQPFFPFLPSTSIGTSAYASIGLSPLPPVPVGASTSTPPTPFSLSPPSESPVFPTPANAFAPTSEDYSGQPFARPFTQDEVLATEVLEDLLRVPSRSSQQQSEAPQLSPFVGSPIAGPCGSQTDDLWLGASSSSASNSLISTCKGWEVTQEDKKPIEETEAAVMLADYFNKGGIGGISALDFGFSTTPSLYPDHLFEPRYKHLDEEQFYIRNEQCYMSYLFPWNVPKVETLSKFGKAAAQNLLPSAPLLHPQFQLTRLPVHLAFSLTVAGASYSPEGHSFANEMLVEKRVFLVRHFNTEGLTQEERFATIQSMLLYQLLGLFHRDEQQRILSHTFHGALVSMLRQLELPRKIKEKQLVTPHRLMQGAELEAAWKAWIEVETWRRVSFIVFLTDIEMATRFETPPFLSFSELTIDLPSSDTLWNARSGHEWLALIVAPIHPAPISFLEAVQVLLSPTDPAPHDRAALLLSELRKLSSFPLLILSRSLSFLQAKTEEAIRQEDPFKTLFGGIGIALDGREHQIREVLARIIKGRETLRRLPGGVNRGGGERWFEGVVPTTPVDSSAVQEELGLGSGLTRSSPSTSFDEDEDDMPVAESPEVSARRAREKVESMARHRERRAGDLRRQFEGFMSGSQGFA
ncbi:hypothetical protein BCR35DRAFT_352677 [Leucosporidium creatinivorum]|uniref:C2H2-type domain-containing protein n=1 Tax=Leucosporidium creatinivorum TaxID=106004 RepID=A0A1Y2F806_9BASI|nr:hypothetical protein BCR35DRAFT_352677 [Leucosporidium creatinivorum]